jgi:uncharacterized protein (DUF1697 family)
MPAYVSFLRGINVGGRNMLAMAKLKALHEDLGFDNVRTHLQSGNVVFTTRKTDPAKLEKKIAAELGGIAVAVRATGDLREVIAKNPFPEQAASQPSATIVIFLIGQPPAEAKKSVLELNVGPELKAFARRELYVFYGAGMGKSKLTNTLLEKKLGVRGTARNWNTVTRMLELAEDLER